MNKVLMRIAIMGMQQILLISVLLGAVYYFALYDDGTDLRMRILGAQTEIDKEQEKKRDTDANLKEESQMKAAVGTLTTQYEEISRRLPTSLSSIELNRNIDTFARNSGVSIKSRTPMKLIPGEIVEEVPVEVLLEGGFGELAQFVYLTALSEKASGFDSFTIENFDAKNPKLHLKAVIVGYQLAHDTKATPKEGATQ